MKKTILTIAAVTLIMLAGHPGQAQTGRTARASVPLSDPSRPAMIEASVFNGGITVRGYEGTEIIVEATARESLITESEPKTEKEKSRGMMRIPLSGNVGLSVEEEDNVVEVSVSSLKQAVDLVVQVPFNTSMELGAFNKGDIVVENVKGELEVNNHNGGITLTDVSGSVVAHTFNGKVIATFTAVDTEKPMSFSTWNGDIDVTFPPSLKAKVKLSSERGEAFSDFDIQLDTSAAPVVEDERDGGGKFRISMNKYIVGTINGGGPEYTFKNYNGDILIRKAK